MERQELAVLRYLMNKYVICVFDIDGTLASYHFSRIRHSVSENIWKQEVTSGGAYEKLRGVPIFKKFISKKIETDGQVYVCSVAQQFEKEHKLEFVRREFGDYLANNTVFVEHKEDKLAYLRELQLLQQTAISESSIAIIDDTVKTLDGIANQSAFITVHTSTFSMLSFNDIDACKA